MNTISISRRRFAQLLGAGAACAVVRPAFSLAAETSTETFADGIVRLSSNENPYGPSATALKAMTDSFGLACRYPDEHADELIDALAKMNGRQSRSDSARRRLGRDSEALRGNIHRPAKRRCALVVADPTFEAILTSRQDPWRESRKDSAHHTFSHDLPKMAAAAKDGLIYICNPNNPTASITPKNAVRQFIEKTPRQTMILVDEAYLHYADSSDYESVIPLIKDHPNLIVARTFSKIYGMAGLRCGYCVGQREDDRAECGPINPGTASTSWRSPRRWRV